MSDNDKKYELTDESIDVNGRTLYRIKAVKDFGDVKKGDLGGYVESEENLSHEGDCWVYDYAYVYGDVQVCGNAQIYGRAEVYDGAQVYGKAEIFNNANVYRHAKICGYAVVSGNAEVGGNCKQCCYWQYP